MDMVLSSGAEAYGGSVEFFAYLSECGMSCRHIKKKKSTHLLLTFLPQPTRSEADSRHVHLPLLSSFRFVSCSSSTLQPPSHFTPIPLFSKIYLFSINIPNHNLPCPCAISSASIRAKRMESWVVGGSYLPLSDYLRICG
jgi:hypothetical protein